MASGLGRLLACVAEEHHDEHGLCWPVSVAPYPLHLVALAGKSEEVAAKAETLYQQLVDAGLEPLYDDRPESPGVKFNDADLIGCPLRLTLSERSLKAGGVEVKVRKTGEVSYHPLENLPACWRRCSLSWTQCRTYRLLRGVLPTSKVVMRPCAATGQAKGRNVSLRDLRQAMTIRSSYEN